MNEKFNKNAKVEQLTKMILSREEEKGLIVKDPNFQLEFDNNKYHRYRHLPSALQHCCALFLPTTKYRSRYLALKLVSTNLNYHVLGTSAATIFLSNVILSMHLLPPMNVMLDYICMGLVDLLEARWKGQNTKRIRVVRRQWCSPGSNNH